MKPTVILVFLSATLGCSDALVDDPEVEPTDAFEFETIEQNDTPEMQNPSLLLRSTWVGEQIGNAVFTQNWWAFEPGGSFKQTDVFGRYGDSIALDKFSGDWSENDRRVTMNARSLTGELFREFTFAIDGTTLYPAAYQKVDDVAWVRSDVVESFDDARFTNRSLRTEVSFSDDPFAAGNPCEMQIQIAISVQLSAAGPTDSAEESFTFPCEVDGEEEVTISANLGRSWGDELQEAGIWDRYPAHLSNLIFSELQPQFVFLESGDLVHTKEARQRRTGQSMPDGPEDVPIPDDF